MLNGNYIRGEGRLDANLMVVGIAPGYNEHIEGRPFVGPSGNLLNKFLHEAGIERSEVYVTNVVKYRLPDDNFGRFRETGLNLQECLSELYREIRTVNPNCILALGAVPLRYLTGRSGKGNSITENRGSILRVVGEAGTTSKVVPTYHPANLLHMQGSEVDDPRVRKWMEFDFARAVEESKTREYNIPRRNLWVARNSLDVHRYLERNKTRKRIAVDIEVIHSIPICIGLAFDHFEAMSVPILDFDSPWHKGRLCSTSRDVTESLLSIARVLSNRELEVIGQNFKFDHDKLETIWIQILGKIIDIMLVHHALYPEFPKSLEFMTSVHTREPFYKIEGREFNFKTDKLEDYLIYNARDAAVTFELAELLIPDLYEFGVDKFFFGFDKSDWRYPFSVQRLHKLYMDMERTGFLFDEGVNAALKIKYKERLKPVQNRIDTLAGFHVNVNAYKKLNYILFEHFKMPKRAGTGEEHLVALMNSPALKNEAHKQILADILEVRRIRKVISTYLSAAPDFDGRMRTIYKIAGTETGRTSTGVLKPPVRPIQVGLSFQQTSKHGEVGPDIRKEFIVDPGYVFLQADAKQAEARVVFLLAKLYDRLREMENPNYDIHSITSSWFFTGETPEQLRKQKLKRFTGKTIRHAGHLRMGKNRAMHTFNDDAQKFNVRDESGKYLSISEWKASQYLDKFHANDTAISEVFWREVDDIVQTKGELTSPHGRKRQFFGDLQDIHTLNEGLAFIPQATIADNTKRAMLAITDEIQAVRFVLEWHDGFLALVPEKEIEAYAKVFIREMEKPIDFAECSLPRGILKIPCELEFSDTNYYELKAYELEVA